MNLSDIELPSNRKFGFFFSAIFLIACAYFYYVGNLTLSYMLGIIGLLFLAVTIIKADALLPLNKLWMRFGLLLGMIISPIVMGVIFFGLFTPISTAMRLFGRDELRLRFKHKTTHWIPRDHSATQTETFKNQF